MKSGLVFLLLSICIAELSDESSLTISTSLIDISISKVYAVFISAIFWATMVLQFGQLLVLIGADAMFAQRMNQTRRFSHLEYALEGQDGANYLLPVRIGNFFSLNKYFMVITSLIVCILIMLSFIPLLSAAARFFVELISLLKADDAVFIESALAALSLALFLLPIIYLGLIFIPVRIQKNRDWIRCSFLDRID